MIQLGDFQGFRALSIADDVRQPEPVRGADGPEPVHGAGGGVGEGGTPRPRMGKAAEKGKTRQKSTLCHIVVHIVSWLVFSKFPYLVCLGSMAAAKLPNCMGTVKDTSYETSFASC